MHSRFDWSSYYTPGIIQILPDCETNRGKEGGRGVMHLFPAGVVNFLSLPIEKILLVEGSILETNPALDSTRN